MYVPEFRVRDSNEKSRDERGFLDLRVRTSKSLKVSLRQLGGRGTRILGNNLLQNAFYLVIVTQAALYVGQLVQRIRHFGVLRVLLTYLGECLTCALKVAFGQIYFTQPVLGIARVRAVRVFAQESGEGLTGLVEILCLDQIEGCFVIKLFLRRVRRLGACCRCLSGLSRRRPTGVYSATRRLRIIGSRSGSATGYTLIEFLITLQSFLLHALDIVLLNLDKPAQTRDFFLHLLQLHEQLTLCRGRRCYPSPGIGAGRAITRWRITAAARARIVIDHRSRTQR